jgi:hypothetical protein
MMVVSMIPGDTNSVIEIKMRRATKSGKMTMADTMVKMDSMCQVSNTSRNTMNSMMNRNWTMEMKVRMLMQRILSTMN